MPLWTSSLFSHSVKISRNSSKLFVFFNFFSPLLWQPKRAKKKNKWPPVETINVFDDASVIEYISWGTLRFITDTLWRELCRSGWADHSTLNGSWFYDWPFAGVESPLKSIYWAFNRTHPLLNVRESTGLSSGLSPFSFLSNSKTRFANGSATGTMKTCGNSKASS